jgi:hypothetical protein
MPGPDIACPSSPVKEIAMRVVKAAAVQVSPVLYSREGTVGLPEFGLAAAARAIRNGDVSSETYQQLTGKPAQTVRDFLFGHKAALTAAA